MDDEQDGHATRRANDMPAKFASGVDAVLREQRIRIGENMYRVVEGDHVFALVCGRLREIPLKTSCHNNIILAKV